MLEATTLLELMSGMRCAAFVPEKQVYDLPSLRHTSSSLLTQVRFFAPRWFASHVHLLVALTPHLNYLPVSAP